MIAERMGLSARITSRVTLFMDVDATDLVIFREKLKKKFEKEWGFAPGYNDILVRIGRVRALPISLHECPPEC